MKHVTPLLRIVAEMRAVGFDNFMKM